MKSEAAVLGILEILMEVILYDPKATPCKRIPTFPTTPVPLLEISTARQAPKLNFNFTRHTRFFIYAKQ